MSTRVLRTVGTDTTPQCFGLYQGSVISTNDPLVQGRVQLLVPQVLGLANSNWAKALGQSSTTTPVIVGQSVFVMFIGGDRNQPVYIPQTWGSTSNLAVAGNLTVAGTSTLHGTTATTLGATGAATLSGGATITSGLTADIINQPLTLYKPADESRGNTTVTNDSDLQNMPVAAGAIYTFELVLHVNGSGTGGLQYQFVKPSGSGGKYTAYQYNLSGGLQSIRSLLSSNNTAAVNNPNPYGILIKGELDNTGNLAGTFSFQWAQQNNSGTSTIEQYSYFRMQRIL